MTATAKQANYIATLIARTPQWDEIVAETLTAQGFVRLPDLTDRQAVSYALKTKGCLGKTKLDLADASALIDALVSR